MKRGAKKKAENRWHQTAERGTAFFLKKLSLGINRLTMFEFLKYKKRCQISLISFVYLFSCFNVATLSKIGYNPKNFIALKQLSEKTIAVLYDIPCI